MSYPDNRRFPRIPHVTSRQVIHMDGAQNPRRRLILTANVSASGVKFTTNSRFEPAQYFLIYLNDRVMEDIRNLTPDVDNCVRAGDYYLTRVVWVREVDGTPGVFDVGAAFVERTACREELLETFTELMNASMLERLPQGAAAN